MSEETHGGSSGGSKGLTALIIALVIILLLLLFLMFYLRLFPMPAPTPYPTPTPYPSPTSYPTPTPTQAPPSTPIQVQQFVIPSDCTGPYCWGRVVFYSSITGTLTKVTTNYNNGQSYAWQGNYNVQQGTNTIWLDDWMPCNHLSCNPPGQIVSLTFTINGQSYTVPVTPTTGDPLSPTPSSQSQIFIGSG